MSATAEVLSGKRKAAILLVLLGDEAATHIYQNLPENELRIVSQEIAELEYVTPEAAAKVLIEFYELATRGEFVAQGGHGYATKLLVKAFGDEGAQSLIDDISKAQEMSAQNLDTLQKTDPQQLAKFIQDEHPQTIALIIAHLNTKAARAVLMLLPDKVRAQAVKRLAQMQQFSPEMVKKISLVLHRRLADIGTQSRRAYGGVKAVADLLNQTDQETSKGILETIETDDAELATSIRNLMFTFEDFLDVPDSGMRELLGQIDKKMLAISLKGASEDLKSHVFKSMSTRAVEMLKEDAEALGPMRAREVHEAQQEIVNIARRLETEGKMVLKVEQGETYVI
jgi:flagellar motor switch protein FliG